MITAEKREEILKDVAEYYSLRLQRALKSVFENGFLVFSKGDTKSRLAGYMRGTLATELPMVLDEDYLEKFRAGMYPAFAQYCNREVRQPPMVNEKGEPLEDPMMLPVLGYCYQPIGHPGPDSPDGQAPFQNLWALLLSLPTEWKEGFVPFTAHQRDFIRLYGDFLAEALS